MKFTKCCETDNIYIMETLVWFLKGFVSFSIPQMAVVLKSLSCKLCIYILKKNVLHVMPVDFLKINDENNYYTRQLLDPRSTDWLNILLQPVDFCVSSQFSIIAEIGNMFFLM